MFGYLKKIKDIEKKNNELIKRVEALEEFMYELKVNEVLKEYSKKYGIEIKLHRYFNGQYYLAIEKGATICRLPCKNGMDEVYREIYNAEKSIKAFMYDLERDELANDKE